jgi:hypothetical protein
MAQGPASVTNRHALSAMSMSGRTANRQLLAKSQAISIAYRFAFLF